uniref:Ig-like domain-containing protein n=1 Tax=Varanus komodoensis TaxID=61221 RepID=A0A8D2JF49_VARKO
MALKPGNIMEPVFTHPPSASVSTENTVRLSCAFSSRVSISNYAVSWYQQTPDSSPSFLLQYYSDSSKHQGSGVPVHFSGYKDASTNSGLLTISGVQPEDEADYYCATEHGRGRNFQIPQWGYLMGKCDKNLLSPPL